MCLKITATLFFFLSTSWATAQAPSAGLELAEYLHAVPYASDSARDIDYELGLGALQKVAGRWRHKRSERVQADLERRTWQVSDPYTAAEAYAWYERQLLAIATPLYQCDGRSCGSSAQWANRVFSQGVLYGHDERQRYSAWRIENAGSPVTTVVLYAVDRANRRHYVHLDVLLHSAR